MIGGHRLCAYPRARAVVCSVASLFLCSFAYLVYASVCVCVCERERERERE